MIPIVKQKPPRALVEETRRLRSTPDAAVTWNEIRRRKEILSDLCREQGCLCAYCMKRIDGETAHVEHIVPQSRCMPEQDIDYRNILAVCDGNEHAGSSKAHTCDRARGDAHLTVNPLRPETLKGIRYRADGVIYSTDEIVQSDLDETLNLNARAAHLPQNRKAVIKSLFRQLEQAERIGSTVGYCRRMRDKIEKCERKPEFVGVLLYFLERRIRRG